MRLQEEESNICYSHIFETCRGVRIYRIAVTVFVEIPGSVKTPLHLRSRLRGVSQLKGRTQKKKMMNKMEEQIKKREMF